MEPLHQVDEARIGAQLVEERVVLQVAQAKFAFRERLVEESEGPVLVKQRIAATATTKINRKDFGVNWSKNLDTGGAVVGDEVDIIIDLEAVKQAAVKAEAKLGMWSVELSGRRAASSCRIFGGPSSQMSQRLTAALK